MIFQNKVDRALKKLHEDSDAGQAERDKQQGINYEQEMPELEKNDFLALVISAFITIVPVALLVLLALGAISYFFLMH